MLKIFKKLRNRTEIKIQKYAQLNANELSRIINRPKEGEIINISSIKINKKFKKPRHEKMTKRLNYFKKYGYFRSTIILNNKNCLIDGYTTYLLAKEIGFDYITILREE